MLLLHFQSFPSSHGILEETKSVINHLPSQHTDYVPVQGGLVTTGSNDSETLGVIWLYHQHSKVAAQPIPTDQVLGVPSGLQENELFLSEETVQNISQVCWRPRLRIGCQYGSYHSCWARRDNRGFGSFPGDNRLCFVQCLRQYEVQEARE